MANSLYTKAKQNILDKKIDFDTDTIKVVLVDSADYTIDLTNHDALDDIPVAARVATGTLASKTITNGVFDAADLTLPTVSGDSCEYVILYMDSGTEATSWLIFAMDTATGLPLTPTGDNVIISWHSSGIFAL